MIFAHCRNNFYREFAYKTLASVDIPYNGILPELRRNRFKPLKSKSDLERAFDRYSNRPGMYISVYAFEKLDNRGQIDYSSAKINRIYLDFDDKENPDKAITEALLVVRSLVRRNVFCHCYFSGGKGIAMYIESQTVEIQNENKKDVIALFYDTVKETVKSDFNYELTTLDPLIKGDISRVSRVPNSKHASGYFCIPLTFGDMRKGLDHIKMLAKHQSNANLESIIEKTILRNSKVPIILKNLERQVIANREAEAKKQKLMTERNNILRSVYNGLEGSISSMDIEKAKNTPLSVIFGNAKKIKCPLHHDTNPSLKIDHAKGLWYCFGCGKGGDAITFIEERDHVDFRTAVKILKEV